ncbi:hypothetical protein PIB30_075454 [Stylosanthes scabra]|uniref:Uncharacterized protein n=1 Tax=Stylosanthes scabra TaxID=79078 RepID=A0ABU6QR33_9FABA|nr:hypothetical protein [Stylosanthes scabra]
MVWSSSIYRRCSASDALSTPNSPATTQRPTFFNSTTTAAAPASAPAPSLVAVSVTAITAFAASDVTWMLLVIPRWFLFLALGGLLFGYDTGAISGPQSHYST